MGRRLDYYRFKTRAIAEQRPDAPSDKKPKPPERPLTWAESKRLWGVFRLLAPFNWLAAYWFYLWRTVPVLRWPIEVGGAAIIAVGAYGFYIDLQQRDIDRVTRHATLMAQLAELASNENRKAVNPAIRRIVRTLVEEKVSLDHISLSNVDLSHLNLSGASLDQADLSGAYLSWADLTGANLNGANLNDAMLTATKLTGANLIAANLVGASLSWADLTDANLNSAMVTEANLDQANLSGADLMWTDVSAPYLLKGLSQEQLNLACQQKQGGAPRVPEGLEWHGRVCERYK